MCPNLGTAGSQFLGLLGNLLLGTLAWDPVPGTLLGTCSWDPCLETNLAWEPLPGNVGTSSWESGSQPCAVRIWLLRRADLAAPTCSGTFTMAEGKNMFLDILLGKCCLETLKTVPRIRACKTYSWNLA
jgi:hypothetical protein